MYGDIITLADALLISVIAMIIVFVGLGVIYGILILFRKIFDQSAKQIPAINAVSDDDNDEELMVVLSAAIAAYEHDVR